MRNENIEGVPHTAYQAVRLVLSVERHSDRVVRFVDPDSVVSDPLAFESLELQGKVWPELHCHIGACCYSSDCLKIFPQHCVTRSWVGSVCDIRDWLIVEEPCLTAEDASLYQIVMLKIFRPQ